VWNYLFLRVADLANAALIEENPIFSTQRCAATLSTTIQNIPKHPVARLLDLPGVGIFWPPRSRDRIPRGLALLRIKFPCRQEL
jgi:hypothetical protein